jgi:RecA-family ATPase
MEKHDFTPTSLERFPSNLTDTPHRKITMGDTPIFVPEACDDWLREIIASKTDIDEGAPTPRDMRNGRNDIDLPATVSTEAKASNRSSANASSKHRLHVINAAELLRQPAKPMEFLVENTIPRNMVTGFLADGGTGKSTMALQLAASGALNRPWLGLPLARPFSTLYLSAEDHADICNERLLRIVRHKTGGDKDAYQRMSRVWIIDATHGTGIDPLLASWMRSEGLRRTPLYHQIKTFIAKNGIDLLIVDSVADVFDEEIDRTAVRSFIRALHALGCTVLLLGHPSVSGMNDGRGYSGSTHWHNAVRARLYMTKPKDKAKDDDARVIDMPKSNYGPSGQQLRVHFDREQLVFVPDGQSSGDPGVEREKREKAAQQRFLEMLRRFDQTEQSVSPKPSSTYAPTVFAKHPDNRKHDPFTKQELEFAMQQLLASGLLNIVEEGPKSKRRQRFHIVSDSDERADANDANKSA